MAGDGALTSGEFEAATSPEYYRTMREHLQPFEDASGAVRRAGREASGDVRRRYVYDETINEVPMRSD